jgi:hypothetical protein
MYNSTGQLGSLFIGGVSSGFPNRLGFYFSTPLFSFLAGGSEVVTVSGAGLQVPIGAITGSGSVPTGGTTGQVLKKVDGTNYNYSWQAESNSWSSITGTPTTIAGYGISDCYTKTEANTAFQPIDTDLTAIAALTTTAFGRGFLPLADATAARTYIGAGTSNFNGTWGALTGTPTTVAGYGITDAVTTTFATATYQPIDADLTAIAAIATTAYGRDLLKQVDGPAVRTYIGCGSAAAATAPTGAIVGTTDTQVLSNKELVPRVVAQASGATWSPNADTTDVFTITTAQAAAVTLINNPSGTPVDGQTMVFRVKCDGTARALSGWGTQYRFSSDMAAPTTLIASKTTYLGFIFNSLDTKWDNIAKMENF